MSDYPQHDTEEFQPRIDEIILPDCVKDDYEAAEPLNSLRGIKRLNTLIGPNNSGKSRLLRELFYASEEMLVGETETGSVRVRSAVRDSVALLPVVTAFHDPVRDLQSKLLAAPLGFHSAGRNYARLEGDPNVFNAAALGIEERLQSIGKNRTSKEVEVCLQLASHLRVISKGVANLASPGGPPNSVPATLRLANAKYIYVPTLRGMRLSSGKESLQHAYFDRTWNDYFANRNRRNSHELDTLEKARAKISGKTILTGLDLYDWLTDKLLGSLKDRELVHEFQRYLSETFFGGSPVALIPRRQHDTVHIKVGNEKERPIERIGDGLQQLIIMTLPLFEHRNVPLFLFIEEPDLFLHPGFQRIFIEAVLADKSRELYVFVTTHSSQFVDVTISSEECAIFRCEKKCQQGANIRQTEEIEPKFSVQNVAFGDLNILTHIGVRPSSVMLSNCTIWVEGLTDRLYFGKYLELLFKEKNMKYTENLHYTFVEYGGGNVTHWSFLDDSGINVNRLCAKLLLIADRDTDKEARHSRLRESLGSRFLLLPVRESENLLTPEVITGIVRSYEGPGVQLQKFSYSQYKQQYLGRFIDNHVLLDKTKSVRYGKLETSYADRSGTVKAKVEFCRRALNQIRSLEDISADAKSVAEQLCGFIVDENS